ncbi:effector-associated domain EAD1-containing protein [Gloeothece verrucosa]|uniref:Effector-associated domain-containing protein n=1 Tax=Gloeothece verrucosa (strain PCC 7822) TaxID=497965 RepID=E0UGA0_GLOV7|nr:effector-associated domain EAD1-containing protein [Gloeothece verrucosa]ADN16719.1 hypothetical protein Cyan7822_4827 [Gloeothece verrucosa PCC 7822]
MQLSGSHLEEIQTALIDAFPNKFELQQFLRFKLEKNLTVIADGDSLTQIVFQLVQTAYSQGWIENLVFEAVNHNPGNKRLKIIVVNYFGNSIKEMGRELGLMFYRLLFEEFLYNDGVISPAELLILEDIKESFELTTEETSTIQNELFEPIATLKKNLNAYLSCYVALIKEQGYPLNANAQDELRMLRSYYELDDDLVAKYENKIKSDLNLLSDNHTRTMNWQSSLFRVWSKLFG